MTSTQTLASRPLKTATKTKIRCVALCVALYSAGQLLFGPGPFLP
jgi:hypothetical protein